MSGEMMGLGESIQFAMRAEYLRGCADERRRIAALLRKASEDADQKADDLDATAPGRTEHFRRVADGYANAAALVESSLSLLGLPTTEREQK